jgi:hypothetical protein
MVRAKPRNVGTPFYCPHCAEKTVWEAEGGDYPVGPEFFCATCGGYFYSPEAPQSRRDGRKGENGKSKGDSGSRSYTATLRCHLSSGFLIER